jgi:hypothetical protein
MSNESRPSALAARTKRSANAFARGARTGVRITRAPIKRSTLSKGATNFVSRSRTRDRTARPSSSGVIARLRGWVTQAPTGWAVTPAKKTFQVQGYMAFEQVIDVRRVPPRPQMRTGSGRCPQPAELGQAHGHSHLRRSEAGLTGGLLDCRPHRLHGCAPSGGTDCRSEANKATLPVLVGQCACVGGRALHSPGSLGLLPSARRAALTSSRP